MLFADAVMADMDRIDAAGLRDEAFPWLQHFRELRDAGKVLVIDGPNACPANTNADRSRPMPARHAGRCCRCDGPIEAGELMTYRSSDRSVAHPSCPKPMPADDVADLAGALLKQLREREVP